MKFYRIPIFRIKVQKSPNRIALLEIKPETPKVSHEFLGELMIADSSVQFFAAMPIGAIRDFLDDDLAEDENGAQMTMNELREKILVTVQRYSPRGFLPVLSFY